MISVFIAYLYPILAYFYIMYRAKSDHKITYFLFCAKIEAVGRDQEIPEKPGKEKDASDAG